MGEYIIVCGGRDYTDRKAVYSYLDGLAERTRIDLVITGGARGADALADEWAQSRGIARIICPANWEGEGKAAGHIRNERMLSLAVEIHRVVAFKGGVGTASMRDKAKKKRIPVEYVHPDPKIAEMLSCG